MKLPRRFAALAVCALAASSCASRTPAPRVAAAGGEARASAPRAEPPPTVAPYPVAQSPASPAPAPEDPATGPATFASGTTIGPPILPLPVTVESAGPCRPGAPGPRNPHGVATAIPGGIRVAFPALRAPCDGPPRFYARAEAGQMILSVQYDMAPREGLRDVVVRVTGLAPGRYVPRVVGFSVVARTMPSDTRELEAVTVP